MRAGPLRVAVALLALFAALSAALAGLTQLRPRPQVLLAHGPGGAAEVVAIVGTGHGIVLTPLAVQVDGSFSIGEFPGFPDAGPIRMRSLPDRTFAVIDMSGTCRPVAIPANLGGGLASSLIVSCNRNGAISWGIALLAGLLVSGLAYASVRRRDGIVMSSIAAGRAWLHARDWLWLVPAGLVVAATSTGGDLPVIRAVASLASQDINIYQFQLQWETLGGGLASGGLPMFPYPALALALVVPIVQFAEVFARLLGVDPIRLSQIALNFSICLALFAGTLVLLRIFVETKLCPPTQARPILLFCILNPFLLYSIAIFGQIDILSVLLLALGLFALTFNRSAAVAASLLALAMAIKLHHLFLLPAVLLYALYLLGRDKQGMRRFGVFAAVLALILVCALLVGVTLVPDFRMLNRINPQAERLFQGLLMFWGPVGVLGVFFVVPAMFIAVAGVWPPRLTKGGHFAMFCLLVGLIVGAYQIVIPSTPGMYAFMLLAVMTFAVAETDALKRFVVSLVSIAGTLSWSITNTGDITRAFMSGGGFFAKMQAGLTISQNERYVSMVMSVERAWVAALMLLLVWSALRLVSNGARGTIRAAGSGGSTGQPG
jgi:hypothetical protein